MTTITATIAKKHNSVWAGKGKVVSIDTSTGIVILCMTTGTMKGDYGGFSIDTVRFHVVRDLTSAE